MNLINQPCYCYLTDCYLLLIPKNLFLFQKVFACKKTILQVLKDPEVEQKAKSLTLLQRKRQFWNLIEGQEGRYIKRKYFEVARYVNSGPETKNERNFEQKSSF